MNSDETADAFSDSFPDEFTMDFDHSPRRAGTPRLPWKRGPVAWKTAKRAEEILENLEKKNRGFFSLRRAAALLGVSTEPLRYSIKRRYLKRDGPRLQISKAELRRFVKWLRDRAEPFDTREHGLARHRCGRSPFSKLNSARFVWPKEQKTLTPKEYAQLAGCHPSLVVKAIHEGELDARRCTPCRWEIARYSWDLKTPKRRLWGKIS